jgi:hypothetical protein
MFSRLIHRFITIVFPYFITLSSHHKILHLTHLSAIHHSNMSNEIDWKGSLPRRVAYRVRKSSGGDYYDDEGYGEFDRRRSSVGCKRRKKLEEVKDDEDGGGVGDRDGGGEDGRDGDEIKCSASPNTPSSDIESASLATASLHTLGRSGLDSSSPLPSLASLHTLGRSEMTYSSPSIASSHTLGKSELGSSSPSIASSHTVGRSELGPSLPSIASSHTLSRFELAYSSPSLASSHTLGRSELGSPPPSLRDRLSYYTVRGCGEASRGSDDICSEDSDEESSDEGDLFREMYRVEKGGG